MSNNDKTEATKIQLTREQQLEFENIQLRLAAAQTEVQQLLARRGAMIDAIAAENDVDLTGWIVNTQEGLIYSPQSVQIQDGQEVAVQ